MFRVGSAIILSENKTMLDYPLRLRSKLLILPLGFLCLWLALGPLAYGSHGQDDVSRIYEKAIKHPERPERDSRRDARRMPEEVLKISRIKPGDKVLEIFAGDGYYTELLSRVVGSQGLVTHHNNQGFSLPLQVILRKRFDIERLSNVERIMQELDDFSPNAGRYDAALMALTYHDYYFEKPGWVGIDEAAFLKRLFIGLKPGGEVTLIDHAAEKGVGTSDAGRLHRIEKSVVISDFEAAGFKLVRQSDVLRNPADTHQLSIFDPRIRGNTDRFILVFQRPR